MASPSPPEQRPRRARLTLKTVRREIEIKIDGFKAEATSRLEGARVSLREAIHTPKVQAQALVRRWRTKLRGLRSRSSTGTRSGDDSDGGYTSSRSVDAEVFHCGVCLTTHDAADGYVLTNCGHRFCRDGIRSWVASKVRDGSAFPTCFHAATAADGDSASTPRRARFLLREKGGGACKAVISEVDIRELLGVCVTPQQRGERAAAAAAATSPLYFMGGKDSRGSSGRGGGSIRLSWNDGDGGADGGVAVNSAAGPAVSSEESATSPAAGLDLGLYELLLASISRPNERQCPRCGHADEGSPATPDTTCGACGEHYCFFHSNAHAPGVACAAYERSQARAWAADNALIGRTCKRCPGCDAPVEKDAGCNTMRCPR